MVGCISFYFLLCISYSLLTKKIESHSNIWIDIDSFHVWDVTGHWSFLKMNFCLRVWLLLEVVLKEDEGKDEHLTKRRKEPLSLQSYLQKKVKNQIRVFASNRCLRFVLFVTWVSSNLKTNPTQVVQFRYWECWERVVLYSDGDIVFQAGTKDFVVATTGWIREGGMVVDYKKKVSMREKK